MPFAPGVVVRRREVLHGQVWLEQPATVVSDAEGVLAVLVEPGSPLTFPAHPFGPHPWSQHSAWGGSIVLQLVRSDDPYAVWKVFEADGTFRHWYVNFEAPLVRGPDHFDVDDHGLDLIIDSRGQLTWKDVDDLHHQRAQGRIDLASVGSVLEAAADVAALVELDERWWSPWDDWVP